ncbi:MULTISPECIES: alpha/beta hydrolase-fold protein [Chryseobacterium]|uniref:alpha/beta hydrolase-fold protein n=1 Tax=Chryseobacterium TaxID=59732 RepID=UPI00195A103D|nr:MULTISPECIES: alpha/beta hydrolase-fold protein [Chryseobacterium]MBM7419738.1 putative alpha/beta superfamily hydrolase [Chryseobacterium sp. JUb44]MDH6209671.1 putative alpha/beta superfamily hydrolase [Chryseobacterium sp. BIGb0186]WSO08423.1 alpha/beta hydrolase-fold protein [Chryseobacterium scophthalmum]
MKFTLNTAEKDSRPIFITGNFNKWNPKDYHFQLTILDENTYSIDIEDQLLGDDIEYKFTKGGWENVELDQYGNITPNRKVKKKSAATNDFVEKWRFNWGPFKDEFFPIVEVISEEFYIPQLDRYRKVWALLPYDYYISDKKYPVLYLQDAQNLFNEGSAYGNWEIDKKLSILAEYGRGDVIVIAVEHGSEDRIKEYIFDNDNVANGSEGKKYIRFVTDTLKPFIDEHYRTKKDRENTGIGGSSLGALISLYSGFLYPEVYSKLLIFSPSLWIEPNNNFPMMSFRVPFKTKIYLYGGEQEGAKMVKRIQVFENYLKRWEKKNLFDFEFKTNINPDGEHSEFYWSQEFPRAIEWLFYNNTENPVEVTPQQENIKNKTI